MGTRGVCLIVEGRESRIQRRESRVTLKIYKNKVKNEKGKNETIEYMTKFSVASFALF